jgi:hypothetical protein
MTEPYQINTTLEERVANLQKLVWGHKKFVNYHILLHIEGTPTEAAKALRSRAEEQASKLDKWGTYNFLSEPYYEHDDFVPETFVAAKEIELLNDYCRSYLIELLDMFEAVKPEQAKELRAKAATSAYLTASLEQIMVKMVPVFNQIP